MRPTLSPVDIVPLNRTLTSLEDLGSFTESGIFYIQPFRDWKATDWWMRVFGMRICNAGVLVDILHQVGAYSEIAREKALALHVLSHSIDSIDNQPIIELAALDAFNKKAGAQLTPYAYLQLYLQNLEDVVIERLNFVYGGLQLKQQRLLRGIYLCDICGKDYSPRPDGSLTPKYTLTDIVCPTCATEDILSQYEFEERVVVQEEAAPAPVVSRPVPEEVPISSFTAPVDDSWICSTCNQPFNTFEELQAHRIQEGH